MEFVFGLFLLTSSKQNKYSHYLYFFNLIFYSNKNEFKTEFAKISKGNTFKVFVETLIKWKKLWSLIFNKMAFIA